MVSALVMSRGNYDFKRLFTLSEFYDRDPSAYYGTLQSVRGHDMDMTGWLEYYVGGLATQMQEVQNKGEKSSRLASCRSKRGLRGSRGLL